MNQDARPKIKANQLRNPLRPIEKPSRIDSSRKQPAILPIAAVNRQKRDESSRAKLAYILGRPHLAQQHQASIDKYISVEQHAEVTGSDTSLQVDLPSYKKHDEISNVRIVKDGGRAISSKRLAGGNAAMERVYRDYSVQPRYDGRYAIDSDAHHRAAVSVNPVKKHAAVIRSSRGELSNIDGRLMNKQRLQPSIIADRKAIRIGRQPYLQAVGRHNAYHYKQPDWWG